MLFVVAEESSTVHAYIASDLSKEGEFAQCTGKLPPGSNVISVTVGPQRITSSDNFSLLVAVAVFDHCGVEFFELSRTPADSKKLAIAHLPSKKMINIHKMPVKQLRLSKKHPQVMVSCGDEQDLYVKLWNLAASKTEPVSSLQTNQIRHKYMAQGHHHDFFSVAAKTSEVRIFQTTFNQGVLRGLEKAMALTLQKREVLSVAYDSCSSKYCVTTAKDQQMIIYSLDEYYKQAKIIGSQTVTSLPELTLSSLCVVEKFKS